MVGLRASLLIVLFLLVIPTNAYPIIISNSAINHTQAKLLVYSIPNEYYKYVDVIEFVSKPIKYYNNDEIANAYYRIWFYNNNCVKGKIWIFWNPPNYNELTHELGHFYEICILKQQTTELFANNFKFLLM